LTTIRHPTFELGYGTVELLLDYIAGRRTDVATVRVPTRLIVRESCGCQPYSTPMVVPRNTGADDSPAAAAFDLGVLIRSMAHAMAAEARYSDAALIEDWCRSLVGAFLASLDQGDPRPLAAALDQLLQDTEVANEDVFAWQAALSVLRAQAGELCEAR